MAAIDDPITATLRAIGAHVVATLAGKWTSTVMPYPVSDAEFRRLIQPAPVAMTAAVEFSGAAETTYLDGTLRVMILLVVAEPILEKRATAANAVAVRAAAALQRWDAHIVYAPGFDPEPVGPVKVMRVAPLNLDGVRLDGFSIMAIDATVALSLIHPDGLALGLPDFAGMDIEWALPGLAEAAADTLNQES